MQQYQEALLNAYLDLSNDGSDLRDMAYAKVILWVLFAEDKPLGTPEIIDKSAFLIGIQSLPATSVTRALALLKMKKLVLEKEEKWSLPDSQKEKIKKQLDYSESITSKILKNKFPNKIDKNTLKDWFNETNSRYFSEGADKLLSLYTKKSKPLHNVETILKPIIKKYGLSEFEGQLLQGYKEFLSSNDREEEERILNLMRSILSSKLVAANISPDILHLDKFKNAAFLLDTNVLFAMRHYRSGELDQAIKSFGQVIKYLGIKLYIADFTKDEYEHVRKREKEHFTEIFDSYSEKIFLGMSNKNDFAQSLLKSKCKTIDDVERFFDDGLAIPDKISDVKIELLTGKRLKGSYYIEGTDKELLEQIRECTIPKFARPKSEHTALHDTRLMKLVQKMNSSTRAYVLTLDASMEMLALSSISDKEEPLWISLYSLVQILAINGAGPNFNPNDLAPLVKMFIEFEEITTEEKYDERDLLILTEKTDRIMELPETKVISLLNRLHQIRLQRSHAEAVREISMEIDRCLRMDASKTDERIKEKEATIASLKDQNAEKERELNKTNSDLVTITKKTVYIYFALRSVIYFLLALAIAWLLRKEILADYVNKSNYGMIEKMLLIISILGFIFTDYFSYTKPKIDNIK